ncbi:hypothetical protein DM02DRAFT_664316 [Periconia macrospinosa]|uniref:Uncharacterized protein n=1 Tax=Periconia macrospinosa TaxID=97972 RepID=A0A2V1D1J2_9PLEO|nr:hypothetical protein DM02DRAFT_664316 [Periconia macrospinosa]
MTPKDIFDPLKAPTEEQLAQRGEEDCRNTDMAELVLELEHDEDTPWLPTSQLPSPKHEDLYLGSWNGTEWTSCSSTERKLLKLVELATCALDRCEETLSSHRVFFAAGYVADLSTINQSTPLSRS